MDGLTFQSATCVLTSTASTKTADALVILCAARCQLWQPELLSYQLVAFGWIYSAGKE